MKSFLFETEQYLSCYIEKFSQLADVNYSVYTDKNQSIFFLEENIKRIDPSCIFNYAAKFKYSEKNLRYSFTKQYFYDHRKNLKKIISRFISFSVSNSNILDTYIENNRNIIFEVDNHDLLIDILNAEKKILHEYIKEAKKVK